MRNHCLSILLGVAAVAGLAARVAAQEKKEPSVSRSARLVSPAGVIRFDAKTAGELQKAWAEHLAAKVTVKNSLGMELTLVPPPNFPQDTGGTTTLFEPYYLGTTEVTQAQWLAVMGTAPELEKTLRGQNRPAIGVSWNQARAFCERLTQQEKNGTYRLPKEREWSYACRAGATTKYSFGDDASLLGQYAWFSSNTVHAAEPYPHDVALKKPNPFGLFDMQGNVWEFCTGEYERLPGEEAVTGMQGGSLRVAAGGGWNSDHEGYPGYPPPFPCRWDSRRYPVPNYSGFDDVGLRVLWTPSGK